jgi:hypothetical protein
LVELSVLPELLVAAAAPPADASVVDAVLVAVAVPADAVA